MYLFLDGMALETREDETYKRIRLAICSGNRTLVLLSLNDGKKLLSDLRDELQADPATIVHALRELERYRMVKQDKQRHYSLSVVGRVLVQKVIDCRRTAEMLTLQEAFWFDHDVSGIPDYLLHSLASLHDSVIVTSPQEHILRAFDTFITLMEEGDELELITHIWHPELVNRLTSLFSHKKTASFVVTDDVLQRALSDFGIDYVKQLLRDGATIYITKRDPRLVFGFAGNAMALGLASADGPPDFSQLLTSRNSEAIAWGRGLFRFYVERSKRVSL